jgi:hypothetical protein
VGDVGEVGSGIPEEDLLGELFKGDFGIHGLCRILTRFCRGPAG